jgi:hypothetical protein
MKLMAFQIGNLFARKACPVRPPGARRPSIKMRHVAPLLGFVVPTLVIGYGVVIPRSCIAGVNALTIGFATTILGACITYVLGIRSALATGAE